MAKQTSAWPSIRRSRYLVCTCVNVCMCAYSCAYVCVCIYTCLWMRALSSGTNRRLCSVSMSHKVFECRAQGLTLRARAECVEQACPLAELSWNQVIRMRTRLMNREEDLCHAALPCGDAWGYESACIVMVRSVRTERHRWSVSVRARTEASNQATRVCVRNKKFCMLTR